MSLSTKCGILLLAAIGAWAVSDYELITRAPQETTGAALRQFQDSDVAAEQLRHADAGKNAWLLFGPLLIVVLAGLLFWDDVAKWCNQSPDARPPPQTSVGDQPSKGDKA